MTRISTILTTLTTQLSLCLFFVSGSALASTNSPNQVTYYETDGTLQQLSFWKRVPPNKAQVKQKDNIGYFNNSQTNQDISLFKFSDEKSFSLINLDNNQALNRIDADTYRQLSQAKNIKFYEFGKGIIESAIFMSDQGVCQDFASKQGINVDFVTNYYPNIVQSPNEFVTTFANMQIYKNDSSRLISEKIDAHAPDAETVQQLKQSLTSEKTLLLQTDAGKLRSFIQYLCISQLK